MKFEEFFLLAFIVLQYFWGQISSTVGRALTLYTANLGSIPEPHLSTAHR